MTLISPDILSRFSEFITSATGLRFNEAQWPELERRLGNAKSEFQFEDTESFITWLLSTQLTKRHIETLASHLTVGETYFFRDSMSFKLLEETILPQIIKAKHEKGKYLRIWSAGCSTGEEPYSIAILLNRVVPDIKNWNITILATDINSKFIKRASEGIYGEWSFRETPDWIKERYFKDRAGGKYEILPFIKKMVIFSYLNLADDIYPSLLNNTNAMDMIFSRNVLMYLSDECSGRVINGFANSLVDGGFLFSSPTDPVRTLSERFTTINFPAVILYKKEAEGRRLKAEGEKIEIRSKRLEVRIGDSENHPPMPPLEKRGGLPLAFENQKNFPTLGKKEGVPLDFVNQRNFPPPEKKEGVPLDFVNQENFPTLNKGGVGGVVPTRGGGGQGEILLTEAAALLKSGHYKEVIDKLKLQVSHGYDIPEAYPLIIRAYANQGLLDEALSWCKKAVSAEVVNPAYHYLTATVLLEKGKTDEAVRSLKNSLYLDPGFVLPYFMLGNIMLGKGNMKSAKKYFKNASDLSASLKPDEVLPESDGITAGRLMEIIGSYDFN